MHIFLDGFLDETSDAPDLLGSLQTYILWPLLQSTKMHKAVMLVTGKITFTAIPSPNRRSTVSNGKRNI